MAKARPILTATPDAKDKGKRPSAAEVRESIRRNTKRLLVPFAKRAQRQRRLTKKLAKLRFG